MLKHRRLDRLGLELFRRGRSFRRFRAALLVRIAIARAVDELLVRLDGLHVVDVARDGAEVHVRHDALDEGEIAIAVSHLATDQASSSALVVCRLERTVVLDDGVDLVDDGGALGAGVRQERFKADGRGQTVADEVDEALDPVHQIVKEDRALGVDLVDEVVECGLVASDEIDEGLNCSLRLGRGHWIISKRQT